MKASRYLPERSVLIAKEKGQEEKNGGIFSEEKGKRKILGDKTNSLVNGALWHWEKRNQISVGKDKKSIQAEEEEVTRFTVSAPVAVLGKVKELQPQPIFSCDVLKCLLHGHLFSWGYVQSVHRSMIDNETKYADLLPNPSYFLNQTNIRPQMRTILFSWITEVHLEFELKEVVLWASFQIFDRFLSKVDVHRSNLQLVGCTSLWIACKYHEIHPPLASDLVHMSDNAFTKDDIIGMEVQMCESLNYKFPIPNAFQFLERFTEVAIASVKGHRLKRRVKYLARYGMERYHLNVKVLQYCPSLLAAGALLAALKLTSHRWTSLCECVSGYSESTLLSSVSQLGEQPIFLQIKKAVMNFNSPLHRAIIFKYKKANRGSVSALRKKGKRHSSRAS